MENHLDWTFGPPVTAQVTGNRRYTSSHENKIGLAAAVYRLADMYGMDTCKKNQLKSFSVAGAIDFEL